MALYSDIWRKKIVFLVHMYWRNKFSDKNCSVCTAESISVCVSHRRYHLLRAELDLLPVLTNIYIWCMLGCPQNWDYIQCNLVYWKKMPGQQTVCVLHACICRSSVARMSFAFGLNMGSIIKCIVSWPKKINKRTQIWTVKHPRSYYLIEKLISIHAV